MLRLAERTRRKAFHLWAWLGLAASLCLATPAAFAATNPGDPLFCKPQEGVGFLIVNGGAGVFTADPDCYGYNVNNDTDLTISTAQGGTMTGTVTGTGIDYVYTPPTPGFTGTDTFNINVTTVYNGAGGTGSAGGTSNSSAGPATLTVTLNVLPATTTLTAGTGEPTTLPIPSGFITNCTPPGNPGLGPAPGAVTGCVTGLSTTTGATVTTSHGTLSPSGSTIAYTPNPGYIGPDSFTYYVTGVNTDGSKALSSGAVTMNVTVALPVPTLSPWAIAMMIAGLLLIGTRMLRGRFV